MAASARALSTVLLQAFLGLLVAVLGGLLRLALQPLLGAEAPFLIALAAVALSTWIAGVAGGVSTLLVGGALVDYTVLYPRYTFTIRENLAGEILFVVVASAMIWQVRRWRRAEEIARETSERLARQFHELEAVYRTAPVGLCVLDRNMRWVRLNERLAEMNGYPIEAHIGRTPMELLPDIGEQAEASLRKILTTGEPLPDFEMSGTTPAYPGVVRWWNERWWPIQNDRGETVGVAVATEEITERKRAEVALQQALDTARRGEAEITSIYNSAPIGLCIFDRDGRFLRINQRLADINGLPPEAHIGRPIGEVVPGIAEQARAFLKQVFETGQPAMGVEIHGEVPSQPGVMRTWLEHWFPVRDKTGEVVAVNVAVEEITARKRAEEELRRANQVKDEFLATLSHELRTPLNAILGWAHMLSRGLVNDGLRQQAVETILRNAEAQTRLVTDVLDVSRMISGKLRIEVRQLDAVVLLREVIDSLQPATRAKQLQVRLLADLEPAIISGDPERMQQVFWNLLSNAVKFTDHGGNITVRVTRGPSMMEVIVSDTGIGINADFLPHAFERFSQADSSASRRHSGLGLGLSIVRHIVELHGGTVTVASEGEGRGSTFTVSLPIRAVREATDLPNLARDRVPIGAREGRDLAGLRVLVVDDVADARTLVAAVLEEEGAHVTLADSSDEGLRKVSEARPDVIVADIGMPGADGYEFLERLRALPGDPGRLTPAIALTAYGSAADRVKALSAGFLAHLTKPVRREELLSAIEFARREGRGEIHS